MKTFAVIAQEFKWYELFKEEVERIGYIYQTNFIPFQKEKMIDQNCFFFADEEGFNADQEAEERPYFPNRFSFSNVYEEGTDGEKIFELPKQWYEAIAWATENYVNGIKPKEEKKDIFERAAELLIIQMPRFYDVNVACGILDILKEEYGEDFSK